MIKNSPGFIGIKKIDLSDDTTVTSGGGTNTQTLQPPQGLIYKICRLMIYIPDPAGSAANDHILSAEWDNSITLQAQALFYLKASFGNPILTSYGSFQANSTEAPGAATQQDNMITGISHNYATYDYPITFDYTNNTDVNQTGTRSLIIYVEVYKDLL